MGIASCSVIDIEGTEGPSTASLGMAERFAVSRFGRSFFFPGVNFVDFEDLMD